MQQCEQLQSNPVSAVQIQGNERSEKEGVVMDVITERGGGERQKQTNKQTDQNDCRFWHEGGLQSLRIYFRSHTCQVMEMKFEEIKEPGRNKVREMKTFFSHQQTIFNKKIRKTINLIWNVVC